MESVNIEMNAIYKESLSDCCISIVIGLDVKFEFLVLQLCSVIGQYFLSISEYSREMPVALSLQLGY